MTSRDLASFRAFNTQVIKQLYQSLPPIPADQFNTMIDMALRRAREESKSGEPE
jgi:hypothetical protein